MTALTVFTPTYNRKDLLPRLYNSLKNQTDKDFIWMIIDDGSTDGTNTLIMEWILEDIIEIKYHYKENGGLHTGYNTAISLINSELCVCIDSDDFMPSGAVSTILHHWNKYGGEDYAGIIGLDFNLHGQAIGGDLPDIKAVHFIALQTKYGYKGDLKFVHRTKLLKQFIPMPSFKGEKNFNPIYAFLQADQQKPLLILNENLCFVDYQENGMTNNIFYQYRNSPYSFNELRRLYMRLSGVSETFKFKNAIHYISGSIFGKDVSFLRTSPKKLYTVLAIPFGILLNIYIRIKTSK